MCLGHLSSFAKTSIHAIRVSSTRLWHTSAFTFRFFIEYTKEIQVAFEAGLPMDMGQILSIPLIIAGVWSIASSTKRAKEKNVEAK